MGPWLCAARTRRDGRGGGRLNEAPTVRLAHTGDLAAIAGLMDLAIDRLQRDFLSDEQIVASRQVMGLDRQLVGDGTYFVAEADGALVGCGGWSQRATLYGGDDGMVPRDVRPLDPATEPARIRAMYTHPDHARRGIGSLILATCERAALAEGFRTAELMSTASGQPLYTRCGYLPVERADADVGGVRVPLIRMRKAL